MKLQQLISELKRRNVFKVATIYGVTAWLLIQIAATTFPQFDFPKWTVQAVILLSVIGFPIALVLAWAYEMVPDKGEEQEQAEAMPTKRRSFWLTTSFVTVMACIAIVLAVSNKGSAKKPELLPQAIREEKVAVAVFNNRTGEEDLDALGFLASEWLTSSLRELQVKTVSPEMIRQYSDKVGILPNNPEKKVSFAEVTGAKYVVVGSYYLQGDSIRLLSRLTSAETGEDLFEFPVIWGVKSQKEALVEEVRQRLLGYWVLRSEDRLDKINVPKYEAYQAILNCFINDLVCHQRAINLDSNFILARIFYMYGASIARLDNKKLDSLYKVNEDYIKKRLDKCTAYELNAFRFVEYQNTINYEAAWKALNKNYESDSMNLLLRHESAFFASAILNRPALGAKRYQTIFDKYDLYKEKFFPNYYYHYFESLNRLERSQEVVDFAMKLLPDDFIKMGEDAFCEVVRAFLILNKIKDAEQLVKKYTTLNKTGKTDPFLKNESIQLVLVYRSIYPNHKDTPFNYLVQAQFSQFNDTLQLTPLFNDSLEYSKQFNNRTWDYYFGTASRLNNFGSKATAFYVLQDWQAAEQVAISLKGKQWTSNNTFNLYMQIWVEGFLGCIYARQHKEQEAKIQLKTLEALQKIYLSHPSIAFTRGAVSYQQAKIYALLNDKKNAVAYLQKSLEEGRTFYLSSFIYDWDLTNLRDYPPYEALIQPKG